MLTEIFLSQAEIFSTPTLKMVINNVGVGEIYMFFAIPILFFICRTECSSYNVGVGNGILIWCVEK